MRSRGRGGAILCGLLLAGAAHGQAPVDTLDVLEVLERRDAYFDSLLHHESTRLDTLGLRTRADSLDQGGAVAVHGVAPRRPVRRLRFDLDPFALTTYDRVEGFRLGSGVEARFGADLSAEADGAYAFSRHEWEGRARLALGGRGRVPGLDLEFRDLVAPFGPNQGEYFTSFWALVAGQDLQDYRRERVFAAMLVPWRRDRSRLALGYFVRREWSVTANTDFHFFGGGTSIEDPNPAVDEGTARGLVLEARYAPEESGVDLALDLGVAGGELGGEFEYSWQTGAIEFAPTLREGSVLRARLAGANTAGGPPAQALAYLGGYGNLRGFERLEFAGKRSLAARLELEWGRDFLAATRIPGLRRLHLQLIPHADAGTTWGEATGVRGPDTNLDGEWRAAVGFGLRRNIYYPGFGSLRFDISWRTDGGEGNPEVWLRLGRFGD